MQIIRSGNLNKFISGGGRDLQASPDWAMAMYGSGWPIAPVTPPKDLNFPRSIDYPINVNATLTPRTGYGIMSFASLLEAYENVTECRTPVNLITRELNSFVPKLVSDDGNEIEDHPYKWMTISPDRKTPWGTWLTRFLKSSEVYNAPAIYIDHIEDEKNGALRYIDGSTLFIIVDEYGNIPDPVKVDEYVKRKAAEESRGVTYPSLGNLIEGIPTSAKELVEMLLNRQATKKENPVTMPAFTQVIKGTPFSWWDKDQVWYQPSNQRMNSPYGESFIEQAWTWIMIIVNLTAFELGHYRTGNMPEGFMTLPKDMYPTQDRITAGELIYNARMSSNPATERMRVRMFPDGTKFIPTKKPDFPRDLYKQAWENILHSIGIPPSEFGSIPGQGLGGKGFKEGAQSDLSRNTLNPRKTFIEGMFNNMLEKADVNDAKFELGYPNEEIDPDKLKAQIYEGMAHGINTLNDALGQLGMNPVAGSMIDDKTPDPRHIANKHLLVAGSTVYILEDLKDVAGVGQPAGKPANGAPAEAEGVIADQHTPEDGKTLEQAIARIMDGRNIDGKTYSIPITTDKVQRTFTLTNNLYKVDITSHDGAMVAVFMPDDIAKELRKIADEMGLPKDAEMELAENMHITLAFLPDFEQAQANSDTINEIISEVAADFPSLEGKIQGYGVFNGKDGKHVVFAMLDAPELPTMRERVLRALDSKGVQYSKEHGFVPHITLAYFPDDYKIPEGFSVPDIDVEIAGLSFALGTKIITAHFGGDGSLQTGKDLVKLTVSELKKHCGLCEEDDDYFNAPISREFKFSFPNEHHVNEVEVVAACPPGLPPKPFVWKPEGGELLELQDMVGGKMFPREEAAYLLDRSLGFYLVPVAYATEVNGERGAALYYVMGNTPSKDISEYAPEWVEKAAVFDYIVSQQDRNTGNWLTHPDDPMRPVLIDNGLTFPVSEERYCESPFCAWMLNKPLSAETLIAIKLLLYDAALWKDLTSLIGSQAVAKAKICAQRLADEGMITVYDHPVEAE